MTSSAELADHLAATDTVAIITTRPSGDEVATPIWATAVDGVGYVRAAYGPRTGWYLRARSGRPVAVALTDGRRAERDPLAVLADPRATVAATPVEPDAAELDAVDDSFRAKYRGSPYGESIVAPGVRALTLRLDAR